MTRYLRSCLSPQGWVLALAVATLFVLCAYPFLALFRLILFSGENGSVTLESFRAVFAADATLTAIRNTFFVSLGVTVASLAIGVPLGWLLTRTDLPGARHLRSWLCLPFAIPPYIGAIAWIFLANPTTGVLNHLFGEGVFNIYSFTGLVFVEASFLYTFVLLTILASLDRMDSSFEEAARLSGASPWRVFTDISLPLLRPALLSGGLLVFLATAASFGVPALIGSPARLFLVTTQIYTLQKMGTTSGLLRAGALSGVLMATALVGLVLVNWISGAKKLQTVSGKATRPSLLELGRWKWPIVLGVGFFFTLVFVLPLGGIVLSSLSRVQGVLTLSNLTLDAWTRTVFEMTETRTALQNSLILSAGAATLAAGLGLFLAYILVKTRVPGRSLLDLLASLPYATPGTVVALALIIAFSGSFLGFFPSLYNTLGLLLLAYVIKFLSFAVKTNADGFRQIDDVLAEAARVSGATWSQTLRTIWLPLLTPSLVAAWFLVFMPAMSELTMTVLLTGPGLETIGTVIFQLQEYADASGGGASVLAVVVVVSVLLLNALVKRLSRGQYGL